MKETTIYYGEMDSPVGPLLLLADEENAIRIDFGTMAELEERMEKWAKRYLKKHTFVADESKVNHIKCELDEYFSKKRDHFTFSFTFYGTEFQKKVWQALLDTSLGKTKTYQDIANAIHNPKAVRAVGGAVGKNPFSIVVPCHRIIGTNGKLVGFGGGLDNKEILLKHEGIL